MGRLLAVMCCLPALRPAQMADPLPSARRSTGIWCGVICAAVIEMCVTLMPACDK